MSLRTRFLVGGILLALVGSGGTGVLVGQRNAAAADRARQEEAKVRAALEARLAALEALRSDVAEGRTRLAGLDGEIKGLRQAIQSDDRTVKVTAEAFLADTLASVEATFQVEATRSSVGQALATAKSLAAKAIRTLQASGVRASDVRTVWDYVYKSYDHPGAFEAEGRVLATIRNPKRIDSIIRAVERAAGPGVQFGYLNFSDEAGAAALREARREAMATAKEKALEYARVAGRHLGPVLAVSEIVAPEATPGVPGRSASSEFFYRPRLVVIVDVVYELA